MKKIIQNGLAFGHVISMIDDESAASFCNDAEREIIAAYRSLTSEYQTEVALMLHGLKKATANLRHRPKLVLVGRTKEVTHE